MKHSSTPSKPHRLNAQSEEAIAALEKRIGSHIEFEEEMERITAHLNEERRRLLDNPAPRGTCPGCFAAIYEGAAAQGWCMDCLPAKTKYEKEAYGY